MPTLAPKHHPWPARKQVDDRPSAYRRGYGGRYWRDLRVLVMGRDAFMCKVCHLPVGRSGHVDHIKPKREGGTDSQENLQTLCHSCHSRKTSEGK